MKRLLLSVILLIVSGCSFIQPKSTLINPDQLIRAKVRVAYQMGLENKDEKRIELNIALWELEKELGIRFDIIAETEFPFASPMFEAGTPVPLIQEIEVMMKGGSCGELHINDGASTICIFSGTITSDFGPDYGTVLGAQSGPIIILSNLNKIAFINVARHEIGHLLGAPHSKSGLMTPALGEIGQQKLLPFSEESIKAIRENLSRLQ